MDFLVSNLNDSGVGSLRWAISQSNSMAGLDQISFDKTLSGGTINLISGLDPLIDQVSINGIIGNSKNPTIAIDFNRNAGLWISGDAASGTTIKGLAFGDANGDGLTFDASNITLQNSYIGLGLDGLTGIPNTGNGILITSRSTNNLIGTLEPLTGIPLADQVSNAISCNGSNGIAVQGSHSNIIANNRIGTSADGRQDLGNGQNGIHLTTSSYNNLIGGLAHQGNDPTKGEFARPGQGNLISGNGAHGVLIDNTSSNNSLLGNFIGTNSQGTAAIANDGDGVSIVNANNNTLRGTTRNESPFIYYNVVSGNRGNGLRVKDSDNTTIQANFFGLGSDNQTVVANGGDGALIEGTSSNTQYGGVIPLGNVNSGNIGNGLAITGQSSGIVSFNTFAGLTAFGGIAPNQKSGIYISSTGGNTRIRTCVISGNLEHGLHITGAAKDIWVDPTIIGLNSYGTKATYESTGSTSVSWANKLDGIRIDGQAQSINIAGNRESVIPQNTISNNGGYGIRLLDQASQIYIDNAYIGPDSVGRSNYGNSLGGIYAGADIRGLQIGHIPSNRRNRRGENQISGNYGDSISLVNPVDAKILFNVLNLNTGNGLTINGGSGNYVVLNRANSNSGYGFSITGSSNNEVVANGGVGNGKGLYN